MNPLKMHKAVALLVAHWALRIAGFAPVYEIRRRDAKATRETVGTLWGRFSAMTPELLGAIERAKAAAATSATVSVHLRATLSTEHGLAEDPDDAIVCGTFDGRMRATAKAYGTVITHGDPQ